MMKTWTYGYSYNNYRDAILSKSYLTIMDHHTKFENDRTIVQIKKELTVPDGQ